MRAMVFDFYREPDVIALDEGAHTGTTRCSAEDS
jgi:hypothetical protein